MLPGDKCHLCHFSGRAITNDKALTRELALGLVNVAYQCLVIPELITVPIRPI